MGSGVSFTIKRHCRHQKRTTSTVRVWTRSTLRFASHPPTTADSIIGRAWTAEELRHKSWEDIQKLWWVCVKERNIMDTQKLERERLKPGYGAFESSARYGQVPYSFFSIFSQFPLPPIHFFPTLPVKYKWIWKFISATKMFGICHHFNRIKKIEWLFPPQKKELEVSTKYYLSTTLPPNICTKDKGNKRGKHSKPVGTLFENCLGSEPTFRVRLLKTYPSTTPLACAGNSTLTPIYIYIY